MLVNRAFDLGCAQTVTGYINYVIYAACDPVIIIFITARAVTCEIETFEGREISLNKVSLRAQQKVR